MPDEHLPTALALVHQAIAVGIFGQIQWDDRADERARSNPDLRGLTPEGLRRLLHTFVCSGGALDERQETRSEWLAANADRPAYYRDYWYRAVVPVPDFFRLVYSSRSACSMMTRRTPGWKS
jgi:hypothetical protein